MAAGRTCVGAAVANAGTSRPWVPAQEVLEQVARDEPIAVADVRAGILDGTLVVLASKRSAERPGFRPVALGLGARKKIAAAVGMGCRDTAHLTADELQLILAAGPDIVSDVSIGGPIVEALRWLRQGVKGPLGSCPTYDIIRPTLREPIGRDRLLEAIDRHVRTGIDFILLHMGVDFELLERAYSSRRVVPVTSRGGGLLINYMRRSGDSNPFLTYLEDILALLREHQVVLDVGDVFRPGCLDDADDELKVKETHILRRVRDIAMRSGVQVLCESGGHIPLSEIPSFIVRQKRMLGYAPLWLLGPMPLDRGIGYDGLVNSIGIATAAQHGGDLFLSLTDVEHYGKPRALDIARSVRQAKVALAIAHRAMGFTDEVERNRRISQARCRRDWAAQVALCLFPEMARELFEREGLLARGQACKMCGEYCPLLTFPS